jgi:8-oxo-dGTP pyrophosphatase MutT (NUDIX family)
MSTRAFSRKLAKTIFKTQWFSIREMPHVSPGEEPYYSISCPDSVAILAQTLDREFILVRQFRPPQGQFTLELPSGYIREGESHPKAVRRELLEETGYCCEDMVYLGSLKLCPSRIDNTIHAYCGTRARVEKDKKDKDIEVVLISPEAFEEYILNETYNEPTGIAIYFISKEKEIFS